LSTPSVPLLLVEDDSAFRKVYGKLLRDAGHEVVEASDRASARAALAARTFPIVILDLMLPPDGSVEKGLDQLREILGARPGTKVVVASGAGDTRHMREAVRAGAHDFLTKPVDPDVLITVVERALARVLLEDRLSTLETSLTRVMPEESMVGQSQAFHEALQLAERIAPSDLPILITGENGTGKELMARTIHRRSRRREGAFVAVNCGALPETLLESALFGHVRGAFTGAVRDRKGLFQEADDGTLFLDEIGDMTAALQVKVLRAVESGEILPVGADAAVHVDVRLVSATNRDLASLQARGEFREDLYWRVKGAEVHLPALRERMGDIPVLAKHFLNQSGHLCADGRARLLSEAAEAALLRHGWPGNLRELRHEMQRATVLAGDRREIQPEDLSFTEAERTPRTPAGTHTLAQKVEALERQEIEEALRRSQGNRTHAAEALGLSRQGLLKKIERFGLT
jgi:DNA-binding NtrC family response regulator